jgi:hypothetical protein
MITAYEPDATFLQMLISIAANAALAATLPYC